MPLTTKGTPYVVSTDLVANYPTVSSDLADHIDDNLQYNAQDINAQTGSGANAYTFALADASLYKLVTATNAATATYTVPPQSAVTWADGAVLRILNQGAGVVTLAAGAGVTLNGSVLTLNQYQYAEIHRTASNTWTVIGIATPPGLVKITDSTFSAQTSLSINNCFSSTYENYRVMLFTTTSANTQINFRMRLSGTDQTTTYYRQRITATNTTVAAEQNQNETFAPLGRVFQAYQGFGFDLFGPNTTNDYKTWSSVSFENQLLGGSSSLMVVGGTIPRGDGLTIYPATGNMTGSVRVYGYRS